MNTKLQPMNNSTPAEFIIPGEEIIDIKIAINEIIEWINNQTPESKCDWHKHLGGGFHCVYCCPDCIGSKSTDKDYLNKNREEWLEASKNDGV